MIHGNGGIPGWVLQIAKKLSKSFVSVTRGR